MRVWYLKALEYAKALTLSLLLLGFLLPFINRKYHYFDCGKDFSKKQLEENNEST